MRIGSPFSLVHLARTAPRAFFGPALDSPRARADQAWTAPIDVPLAMLAGFVVRAIPNLRRNLSGAERIESLRRLKSLPPIEIAIVPDGRARMLDGSHRLLVARERGDQSGTEALVAHVGAFMMAQRANSNVEAVVAALARDARYQELRAGLGTPPLSMWTDLHRGAEIQGLLGLHLGALDEFKALRGKRFDGPNRVTLSYVDDEAIPRELRDRLWSWEIADAAMLATAATEGGVRVALAEVVVKHLRRWLHFWRSLGISMPSTIPADVNWPAAFAVFERDRASSIDWAAAIANLPAHAKDLLGELASEEPPDDVLEMDDGPE